MAGEKARYMLKRSADATTEALREWEQNGTLERLQGQRLDLSDDSPDWFLHNLLRQEGLGPPVLERAKDLDAAQHAAEQIIERIRRRRAWLSLPEAHCTSGGARAFNEAREAALDEYRAALTELNRGILTYNLTAPSPMHRRGIVVDRAVADAAHELPPLDIPADPPAPVVQPSPLRRVWQQLRRAR